MSTLLNTRFVTLCDVKRGPEIVFLFHSKVYSKGTSINQGKKEKTGKSKYRKNGQKANSYGD